jgi:hypothetical protein
MRMINKKVILGAILVVFVCFLYLFLWLNGLSYRQQSALLPKAKLTVIAAEVIPTVDSRFLQVTPSPTAQPFIEVNGIAAGYYVKISGTEGVGLRIRREPGISSEVVFLGNESEVFTVIGGPIEKDGFLWWQLTAPYDSSRSGWASADFLAALTEEKQP